MKTLLKSLKKSYIYILFIIILLVIQAFLELELPSYTSSIINIGISNKGIEEATPSVISQKEFDNIALYLHQNELDTINKNYSLITKEQLTKQEYLEYKNKYPYIDTDNLYVINKNSSKKSLDNIFKKAINLYQITTIDNNKYDIKSMLNINEDDYLTYLKNIDTENRYQAIDDAYQKTSNITDTFGSTIATTYLTQEYTKIGLDIDKIQLDYILTTGLKMLLIALCIMICACLVGFFGAIVSARMGVTLRSEILNKVLDFSSTEVKKFGVASLITRSTNDINQIQNMLVMVFRTIIFAPIIAVGAIIKVMNTNVSMTYLIALAVLVIISTVATLFIITMPKFKKLQKQIDKLNLTMREIINGIPVIRAFTNEKHEEQRFDKENTNLTKLSLFLDKTMSLMYPIMMLVMNGTALLIVYYGAKNIEIGALGLGDMMAFIQYAMQIIMSFLMISIVSIIIPRAMVSVNRINEVMTTKNSIINKNNKKINPKKKGEIEFKNVYFKYPDADEYILKDISFVAKKGETTAFIGSTGSGKSTLINLIPRLFEVTLGSITVGGVSIKDLDENYLHDMIGYVPQKGILFTGTIASNIKYGNDKIKDEDMILASDIACASDFINEKTNKYNYHIAQGGTNVSGGQKQRISIARAIAKNPDIYIFDDSFSALDQKTDAKVRHNLSKKMKGKTVLIVGSRINTIMNADKIIVLDEGKIVGIGTHETLLKSCKIYNEIAKSQLGRSNL